MHAGLFQVLHFVVYKGYRIVGGRKPPQAAEESK
jgi:hypothetical protein